MREDRTGSVPGSKGASKGSAALPDAAAASVLLHVWAFVVCGFVVL